MVHHPQLVQLSIHNGLDGQPSTFLTVRSGKTFELHMIVKQALGMRIDLRIYTNGVYK